MDVGDQGRKLPASFDLNGREGTEGRGIRHHAGMEREEGAGQGEDS